MAKLPQKTLKQQLDTITVENDYPRGYVGGSEIAHPCARYLYYKFHWCFKTKLEGKLNNIFRIGDAIEDLVIEDLKRVGVKFLAYQQHVEGFENHAGGHTDGIVIGVPEYPDEKMLFECKSMNHTNFLAMKKNKLEKGNPKYYGQVQRYMGSLGLELCVFIAMDKDKSEYYIEFVPFDITKYEELIHREELIITSEHVSQFPKISNNKTWHVCKFCDAKEVCHNGARPEQNCRTCEYHEIHPNGVWKCGREHMETHLSQQQQKVGCEHYKLSESFS